MLKKGKEEWFYKTFRADHTSTGHLSVETFESSLETWTPHVPTVALCIQTKSQENFDFEEDSWKKMIGERYEINNK